jgi:hypothetical protein
MSRRAAFEIACSRKHAPWLDFDTPESARCTR